MKFIYVEVLRKNGDGMWEINLETQKALFRDNDHKREKDSEELHDWHEVYTTIEQFLKENLKMKYVKEIIPDTKYIFSNEVDYCSHFDTGLVAHNPNSRIHCTRPATVYRNGEPLCNEHGHVNF